ncbi:non-specific lipid-transfer protein 1-like [Solanum verrucosum]|uniref:non-specific lipid-transfer protein 1-like n=1 Tax=Solanum verrucosum TaxID=315347 RepID=UPI0020CFFEF7|nr:non-specific lipid-transfer protein 1-like [Solanum verrucosum]
MAISTIMLNKQLFPILLIRIAVVMATITATTSQDATLTCNTVYTTLEPCLGYVLGGGLSVPSECCSGIKSLNSARTIADRQSACKCIKSVVSSSTVVPVSRAAKLPGICNANVPFNISPHVDCSKTK